jgi:hypothetical protein
MRVTATGEKEYFVKWAGYGTKDNQWLPEANMGADDAIAVFVAAQKSKKARKATVLDASSSLQPPDSSKRKHEQKSQQEFYDELLVEEDSRLIGRKLTSSLSSALWEKALQQASAQDIYTEDGKRPRRN